MKTHLIFDLGGTLIFDPFDQTLAEIAEKPLRHQLERGLAASAVDDFIQSWKHENASFNFPFAAHFLQEEVFITRAAWPAYEANLVVSRAEFPTWTAELLALYRRTALTVIARQIHLRELRKALVAGRDRNYFLSVASNDRYGATAAMLDAAGILELFDFVATSEGLSFKTPGAEKPSITFFGALERSAGIEFNAASSFYIGDDETRDIVSIKALPMRSVRFLGNLSPSKGWLDNPKATSAHFHYADYGELFRLIDAGTFESD